jgi:hypothetical protein
MQHLFMSDNKYFRSHKFFSNHLAIEQVHYSVGITGISVRVSNHYNCCSLFVKFGQKINNLNTILLFSALQHPKIFITKKS